jgi:hypothetical protein
MVSRAKTKDASAQNQRSFKLAIIVEQQEQSIKPSLPNQSKAKVKGCIRRPILCGIYFVRGNNALILFHRNFTDDSS